MTQYTAKEVRELAATIWPDLSGREEVAEMLHAYADRLEADEKAQAQSQAVSVPALERFVVIDRAALNRMLTTRDFSELMLAAQTQRPARTCSDERPCVNCYSGQGECLGPPPETIRQRQEQPSAASMQCIWAEDNDGNWDTGCGNMFVLTEGTPFDNEMGFCCYCGHKLDQVTQQAAARGNPND